MPYYCEHDKLVDGGDFFEPEEVPGCLVCDRVTDHKCSWIEAGMLLDQLESYDGFRLAQSGDDNGACRVDVAGRYGTGSTLPLAIIAALRVKPL
jgi:hypothetical protein